MTAIHRASANDLMELATETPSAPMHVAAVLRLDRSVDPARVPEVLSTRIRAVPRLRQRLVRAPLGAGRPFWVDDANFDITRHLTVVRCPAPGDDAALLDVAAATATSRLPRDRPLWSLTVVTGLADGHTALILVLHHVLTDGVGGVAALGSLMDGAPTLPARPFPAPAPSATALWTDATRGRVRAVAVLPRTVKLARDAVAELRLGHARRAAESSLNQPTGPRRQLAAIAVPLAAVIDLAHHHGATVNDVILTAVAGALSTVLAERGESVSSFVISVPVSARRDTTATELGNQVGVMPVEVPSLGGPLDRLAVVAASTRTARHSHTRGASAPLLAQAFRLLARLGVFAWLVNHQRLVSTFVTNVHGPRTPMTFMGARVTDVIPIGSIAGNVTVAFAALSYGGTLTVTVTADPDHCPDLPQIAAALQDQLISLASSAPTGGSKKPSRDRSSAEWRVH